MVRKLFRLTLLLAIFLAAVAFYGWSHLGRILDQFNKEMPNGYSLLYSDHYLDLDGRLILLNPSLTHDSYGVIFKATQLIYTPQKVTDYFALSDNMITGDFPETGQFDVVDLTIPVNQLSKAVPGSFDNYFGKIVAQGCSTVESFTLKDLVKMGYSKIHGKFNVDYQYNGLAANLKLNTSLQLKEFSSFEWQIELNDVKANSDRLPYIEYGQWVLYNLDVLKARNKYCANLNNQSIEEFKQAHFDSAMSFLSDSGIQPSERLQSQYSQFNQDPENVALTFSPKTGIRIVKLDEMSPSEKLDLLGIKLNINGRAVEPIVKEVVIESTIEPTEPELSEEEKRRIANTIIRPNVSQLKSLIGKLIMLEDENGKWYEGKITSVTSSLVRFEIRSSGGKAEIRFSPKQIKETLKL